MNNHLCWGCAKPMEISDDVLSCPTCQARCRLSNSPCAFCGKFVWEVEDVGLVVKHFQQQGSWTMPGTFWCLNCGQWDCRIEDLTPSKNTTERWIYARGTGEGRYESGQTYVGKWLIYVPRGGIDEVWTRVRQASEIGSLGIAAKVSTCYPSSYKDHVICVYTYDFRDKTDVERVLKNLREIGIAGKIYYKTDQATLNGQYSALAAGPTTKKKGRSSLYSSSDFEG